MGLVLFFGILTIAGAVCTRLINTNRRYWAIGYGVVAFMFFIGLLIRMQQFSKPVVILIIVSAIGFLGPEIWHATQNVVRQSRAVGISVLVMLGSLLALMFPEITVQIITIGIIFSILWYIIQPLIRPRRP